MEEDEAKEKEINTDYFQRNKRKSVIEFASIDKESDNQAVNKAKKSIFSLINYFLTNSVFGYYL